MASKQMGSEERVKVKNQDMPPEGQGSPPETPPSSEEELFAKFISKLGKDTFSYLPAVIIPAVLGVISVMVFTRIFIPDVYGQYALVVASTGILTSLLSAWIQQSVVRYLPRSREEGHLPDFLNNLTAILLTITVAVASLSALIYLFLKPSLGAYSRFYGAGVLLIISGFIFGNLNTVFQANLQPKKYAKYQVAYAVGRLSFAMALIFLISRDVVSLIIGAVVGYVILIGPMIKELRLFNHWKGLVKSFDPSLLKTFALYGFPMIGWFMGAQILGISDKFIIGAFKGAAQVGIYASNYGLVSRGIGLISGPILMATSPLIINAWESGNKDRIGKIIAAFSRYFLLVAVPFMAYVSVFSREIATILLGRSYREGYVIIPVILAGFLAWNFTMYGHKGLEIMEKTRIMLLLVMICAGVNVVLNLIFVPLYGYKGAAATTLISYLLYPLLVYPTTKHYIKWQIPWRSMGNITISSLAIAGLLGALKFAFIGRMNVILALAISAVVAFPVYLGLLYVMREVRGYEIRYLKRKAASLGFRYRQ